MILNNKETVSNKIRNAVIKKHISYIDSVLEYCYTHETEIETIVRFLDQEILDHLKNEGDNLNMLKKSSDRLPI